MVGDTGGWRETKDLKSCFLYLYSRHPYLSAYLLLWLFVSPFHHSLSPRSDHLGADDIRRQAVRWHPHQRDPRHTGERGAFASASHLHHRRVHGDGQMWENTQKLTNPSNTYSEPSIWVPKKVQYAIKCKAFWANVLFLAAVGTRWWTNIIIINYGVHFHRSSKN